LFSIQAQTTCFYQGSEERMAEALAEFRRQGGRFLVAGRVDPAGRFLGLDDLDMPAAHRDLFTAIPATEFRLDISSTHLRAQTGQDRVPEGSG
jgi:hypothetical protein